MDEKMNEIDNELFQSVEFEKKEFEIKDIGAADWALAKVKKTEEEYNKIINHLDGVIEKAKILKSGYESKRTADSEFLIEKLKAWAMANITGKSKHIDLINGRLGFRKNPPSVEITDQAAVLFCVEKGINISAEIKINASQEMIEKIFEAVIGKLDKKEIESVSVNTKPSKTDIKNYFIEKAVDSAKFPGGEFYNDKTTFYIK